MKRKHHDCALVRIEALEAKLARAIDELRQAVAMRNVFAKALVVSVDETEKLQGHPVDKSPDLQVPDNDMVICPNCVLQFRAIPVNVQHELAAERKRREAAEKDAARYRWLKINARRIDFAGLCVSDGAQLDARIDAAMSKD